MLRWIWAIAISLVIGSLIFSPGMKVLAEDPPESSPSSDRLQEKIGEWRTRLLRLEGGESLYDSDGRAVINEDGTEGLTLGTIRELRDQANSQQQQAEDNIAHAQTLRGQAGKARMEAELAQTPENVEFYLGQAEAYDGHANILESNAEILSGSARGINAQTGALETEAAQTKKNIAGALSELEGRGVDVSGLDSDGASDGESSGSDDGELPVDAEGENYLGGNESVDGDLSEFDPPDENDSDSDESVTHDSSADAVTDTTDGVTTDSSSTDSDGTDGGDSNDPGDLSVTEEQDKFFRDRGGNRGKPRVSKKIPAGAIGVDPNGGWIFPDSPPQCGNEARFRARQGCSGDDSVANPKNSKKAGGSDGSAPVKVTLPEPVDGQDNTGEGKDHDSAGDSSGMDALPGQDNEKKHGKKNEKKAGQPKAMILTSSGNHSQCEIPQGGFQCGTHLQWWLANHRHLTPGNASGASSTDPGCDYRYGDTLKAYNDPENADTDQNGVIDNHEAIEYAKRLARARKDCPEEGEKAPEGSGNSSGAGVNTSDGDNDKKSGEKARKGVSNDGHSHCEKPKGGFQCGQHYIWWLENHDHVTVGNDRPDSQDQERAPEAPKGNGTNRGGSSTGTSGGNQPGVEIPSGGGGTDSSENVPTPSAKPQVAGNRQAPSSPNTVLDGQLKALATQVTGPQDDDGNFLVPWVFEDIVVSPQVIQGLLLIRDMHVVHLESLAAKLNNTVALPRADKIRMARGLRDLSASQVRPAFVNFVSAQSQVARYPYRNGRRGSDAETVYNILINSKDPAVREDAEGHVWAIFLRRRAEYYSLLAQNPVLGIQHDGEYFYNALRNMPASAPDQDYVEIFNKFLKAGAALALEQATEAAAITELDDLWDFGGPRYTRAQHDAVTLTEGLGATIGSELIDAVRLHFKAAELSSEFEAGVIDVSLGILAALAFPIPGIGPFISAGIAAGIVGVEGGRYGLTYLDELRAHSTAAVTGYEQVMAAEDATSAAGDRFEMAVVFAAFELGSLQAARILGRSKDVSKAAQTGGHIVTAADDVADGARGLSRTDADHWISTVPEGHRGRFIAGELTELDKVVQGAQRAGLTEADIAPVLAGLRQNASLTFEAIGAVERELMVTLARQRGLTVMVHPDSMVEFLRFAGNADFSHVRSMNLVELADIRVKALLESSGKPQLWTQAEIDLVNQVIRPAGDDATRWVSFEALQGLDPADVGLRQIFTPDDLRAIDQAFDGRNLNVTPSPSSATGSSTQRFPMEMPSPGHDTSIIRIEVPGAETQILTPAFELRPLSGTTPRVKTQMLPRPSNGQ